LDFFHIWEECAEMTTIAYRAGILAADTAACFGGSIYDSGIAKIVLGPDGELGAAAGLAGYSTAFLGWVKGGRVGLVPVAVETEHTFDRGVVFFSDGTISVFEPSGEYRAKPKYFAFGSGRDHALGAMFAGASAEMAVRAAMEHDPHTGGQVSVLRHG
jgi:hypothetical protein